jgi:hypothetical protein
MNPKDLVGAKKAPLKLVPPAAVIGTAEAMAIGAAKYGPYNWRDQPIEVMTYIEAVLRHIYAFVDGQDNAEDTGVHHLKHAAAGLAILLDVMAYPQVEATPYHYIDNRPPKGPAADALRAQDRSTKTLVPQRVEQIKPFEADLGAAQQGRFRIPTAAACICPVYYTAAEDHAFDCPAWR